MQVYTGKPADNDPEANQVKFVVLELEWRFQDTLDDNFFICYALGEELSEASVILASLPPYTNKTCPVTFDRCYFMRLYENFKWLKKTNVLGNVEPSIHIVINNILCLTRLFVIVKYEDDVFRTRIQGV